MTTRLHLVFGFSAFVTLATAATAQVFTIDDFENGAFYLRDDVADGSAPGSVQGSLPSTSVIGGERGPSTLLWNVSANSPAVFSLDLSGAGNHGVKLEVPAASKAGGGLLYPGPGFGGLGEDFIGRGVTGFSFAFAQDPGNGTLDISADGPAGNVSASIALTGIKNYVVPVSAFTGPGAVFGDVDSIFVLMTFDAPGSAVTAELSDITAMAAVPEPAEYAAVLGLTLVAFGAWRRLR